MLDVLVRYSSSVPDLQDLATAVVRLDLHFHFTPLKFFQQKIKSEFLIWFAKHWQTHNFTDHMFKVREALAVGKAVNQVDRLPLPQRLLDVLKF